MKFVLTKFVLTKDLVYICNYIMYTANVYKDLQVLCREFRVWGFKTENSMSYTTSMIIGLLGSACISLVPFGSFWVSLGLLGSTWFRFDLLGSAWVSWFCSFLLGSFWVHLGLLGPAFVCPVRSSFSLFRLV